MKAMVYHQYGSPDNLELTEIDPPIPRDNEVLVKVYAASINSWDWDLLRGTPFVNRLMFGVFRPHKILGCDIAGKVEEVGKGISQFKPGDEVFGDLSSSGWGGFAEYVCARENALVMKPACLSFEQAAAVPQAALLAQQGLRYKGGLQPEKTNRTQRVLINGAGGGVGSFAVPMAKLSGFEVTGVDSADKFDFMRALGADHVIDFITEDFTKNGWHYDLILDVQGHHSIFDYRRALSPGGIYVMVGGTSKLVWQLTFLGPWISMTEHKKMGLLLHKANKGLDFMIELFEAGKVMPVIDRCYPLSEAADALRYFGGGGVKGKTVITVSDDL